MDTPHRHQDRGDPHQLATRLRRPVYVGVSSGQNVLGTEFACCDFRGHVDALDADTGAHKYAPSGGGVWSSPVIDPLTNGDPAQQQEYCPNLPEGTALDFDLGATANVFTADGRRMIGIGQKSGVYHVLDAHTGEIVWQRQLGKPMIPGPRLPDGPRWPLSAAGGPVVSNGMVYVQSGNAFSPYPNEHGHVFLAYGL